MLNSLHQKKNIARGLGCDSRVWIYQQPKFQVPYNNLQHVSVSRVQKMHRFEFSISKFSVDPLLEFIPELFFPYCILFLCH